MIIVKSTALYNWKLLRELIFNVLRKNEMVIMWFDRGVSDYSGNHIAIYNFIKWTLWSYTMLHANHVSVKLKNKVCFL